MSLPESSTNAVLACFFEGTANCLQPTTTQIGQFFDACDHYDITEMLAEPDPNLQAFKMGFDGCGYAYGPPGTIWAVGLGSQCQVVVARVQWLLQTRRHVTVVALGLSRGGVAALMLAKRLGGFDPERLSVQLCAFDPVPGNLVCASRYIDLLGLNAANCVLDCSGCRTLRRVLALYPHEPLPDLAFHAPIFPRYPSSDWCEIEEDAVLGCHQGALYPHKHVHPQLRTACKVCPAPRAATSNRLEDGSTGSLSPRSLRRSPRWSSDAPYPRASVASACPHPLLTASPALHRHLLSSSLISRVLATHPRAGVVHSHPRLSARVRRAPKRQPGARRRRRSPARVPAGVRG